MIHKGINRENLELVIEECAEVIQASTKILRFGIDDSHPTYHDGVPNSQALIIEIGQLLHCIDRLNLPESLIAQAKEAKRDQLKVFGPEGTYLNDR